MQLDIELQGNRAAFYRVYQHAGVHQIALVLLNKGDAETAFSIDAMLQPGSWHSPLDASTQQVATGGKLEARVPAHGVQVFVLDAPVTHTALASALNVAMAGARLP